LNAKAKSGSLDTTKIIARIKNASLLMNDPGVITRDGFPW